MKLLSLLALSLCLSLPAAAAPPDDALDKLVLAAGTPAPSFALAQAEAPAPAQTPVIAPGVPDLEAAPLQFAGVVLQLAQQGKWGALAGLLVFALVWAVRRFAKVLPDGKVKETLLSKWGGWTLNVLVAISAGFAGLLFLGAPVTALSVVGIVGGALTYALTAAGVVELTKDVTAKGDAAAAGIASKADAVAELAKGPPAP